MDTYVKYCAELTHCLKVNLGFSPPQIINSAYLAQERKPCLLNTICKGSLCQQRMGTMLSLHKQDQEAFLITDSHLPGRDGF